MDKDKKSKIAEWTAKGTEWCAKQLWEARKVNQRTENEKQVWKRKAMHSWSQQKVDVYLLEAANANMANVLRENGIKPTRLRVTYISRDCDNCECKPEDGYESDVCFNCGDIWNGRPHWEEESEHIESISFYTYSINNGYLSGITSQFNSVRDYYLRKVVDERTGEVIGEWEIPEEE